MYLWFFLVLLPVLVWTFFARKLTLAGTLVAGLMAFAIFAGAGRTGTLLLGGFFILGTGVTLWRKSEKIKAGLAENETSQRNAGQVLANGGVGMALGIAAWLFPEYAEQFQMMMAGAFAAAAGDTCSSELGVLYGRNFYNIRTGKRDEKGLDGVISLEGTLLGVAGSFLIALIYVVSAGAGWKAGLLVVVAGTVGNLTDSYLGATLERGGVLGNNRVNLANTAAGAGVIALLLAAA